MVPRLLWMSETQWWRLVFLFLTMWSKSQRLEASGFPCIVVKEAIEILADNANENDKAEKNVAFKYNAYLDHVFQNLTVQ